MDSVLCSSYEAPLERVEYLECTGTYSSCRLNLKETARVELAESIRSRRAISVYCLCLSNSLVSLTEIIQLMKKNRQKKCSGNLPHAERGVKLLFQFSWRIAGSRGRSDSPPHTLT
jgi:hypothetical protein